MKFLRTIPNNGRFDRLGAGSFRPLAPEARTFWQAHGADIAAVLRPETPLSLAEILEACAEYQLDHPEGGVGVDEVTVAWVLLRLVECGLAQVVMPGGACRRLPRQYQRPAL
jgi:hypothetical protein